MPRICASSIKRPAGEFAVTPWQRKRQAAPRNDNDLYSEIAVPVVSPRQTPHARDACSACGLSNGVDVRAQASRALSD